MPSLVLWILAVYGLVFLVAESEIFERWIPVRPLLRKSAFLRRLLSCAFCTGIWMAFGLWVLWLWPHPWRREGVFYVLAGAASAYVLDRVVLLAEVIISGHHNPPDA